MVWYIQLHLTIKDHKNVRKNVLHLTIKAHGSVMGKKSRMIISYFRDERIGSRKLRDLPSGKLT